MKTILITTTLFLGLTGPIAFPRVAWARQPPAGFSAGARHQSRIDVESSSSNEVSATVDSTSSLETESEAELAPQEATAQVEGEGRALRRRSASVTSAAQAEVPAHDSAASTEVESVLDGGASGNSLGTSGRGLLQASKTPLPVLGAPVASGSVGSEGQGGAPASGHGLLERVRIEGGVDFELPREERRGRSTEISVVGAHQGVVGSRFLCGGAGVQSRTGVRMSVPATGGASVGLGSRSGVRLGLGGL